MEEDSMTKSEMFLTIFGYMAAIGLMIMISTVVIAAAKVFGILP